MKKKYVSKVAIASLFVLGALGTAAAQTFHKGALLVSISEGNTMANYKTAHIDDTHPAQVHSESMEGVRDPLIIEYGISKHWGLGLSSGKDIFKVNSSDFYGFKLSDNQQLKVAVSEFTFDENYHFFANKRLDLSVFTSLGVYSVSFKGKDESDGNPYNYTANGNIIRMGMHARYYFAKRLGVFGMLSSYHGSSSTKDVKGNTVGNNYATTINGFAIEAGLCFRLF